MPKGVFVTFTFPIDADSEGLLRYAATFCNVCCIIEDSLEQSVLAPIYCANMLSTELFAGGVAKIFNKVTSLNSAEEKDCFFKEIFDDRQVFFSHRPECAYRTVMERFFAQNEMVRIRRGEKRGEYILEEFLLDTAAFKEKEKSIK